MVKLGVQTGCKVFKHTQCLNTWSNEVFKRLNSYLMLNSHRIIHTKTAKTRLKAPRLKIFFACGGQS